MKVIIYLLNTYKTNKLTKWFVFSHQKGKEIKEHPQYQVIRADSYSHHIPIIYSLITT